jgi:histidinol dehydrogenase
MLVTWEPDLVDAVEAELADLTATVPRGDAAAEALGAAGRAVLVRDAAQALEVANLVAPEHLELVVQDPEALVPLLRNAGAVFCGATGATALGDYVAGANHVLPTGRTARFASALRVDDFRKHIHVVRATPEGAAVLSKVGAVIARAEGLDVHAHSLDLRSAP